MRQKFRHRRKTSKDLKAALDMAANFLRLPFVRPVLIITAAVCLLMIVLPWAVVRFTPEKPEKEKVLLPEAGFELKEVPSDITIYRTASGTAETIDFEDYVKGVVSGEMPSTFHIEALKAQAVAARTYSLARVLSAASEGNPQAHPAAPLCDSTHCQVYRSPSELEQLKGGDWMKDDWKKICRATDETKGQLLYYNGELVEQALFHSSSGGKTENSEDVFAAAVPYLTSVDSPYEEKATHREEKHAFTVSELASAVKSSYPGTDFGNITADSIKILDRSSGNRVASMQFGSGTLTGREVREALDLPSANFTVDISGNTVTFTSNGSGHGVGMSQYGADGMAENGYGYKEILSHYYSGTQVF